MSWSRAQAKEQVKLLRKELAAAWEWMTPAMREALVTQRCFLIVAGQHSTVIKTAAAWELWRMMMYEARLRDEAEDVAKEVNDTKWGDQ